jgi:hypothetical protein
MPAQTTNLFLLEELEDVGRTSELAQSDLDEIRWTNLRGSHQSTTRASDHSSRPCRFCS